MILPDGSVPGDNGVHALVRRIVNLERQVREQAAARRLESSSIGSGGLTVKGGEILINGGAFRVVDENGTLIGYIGKLANDSTGMIFYRADGSMAFTVNGAGAKQYAAMVDRQGNIVVSDDTEAGQGLATPYIPLPFYPLRVPDPIVWTDAAEATWAALWNIPFLKQHPQAYVKALAIVETGTTGEIRLWDAFNSVQYGPTISASADTGDWLTFGGPFPFAGSFQEDSLLQVQMRVTGGTGRVGSQVYYAYGRQS